MIPSIPIGFAGTIQPAAAVSGLVLARNLGDLRSAGRTGCYVARRVFDVGLAGPGPISGDVYLPDRVFAVLSGRPDGDGPFCGGALPLPGPSRCRVLYPVAQPVQAGWPAREVASEASRGRPATSERVAAAQTALPRSDCSLLFRATRARLCSECLSPAAIRQVGLFDPVNVSRLEKKAREGLPLGETDEMALIGIISTQLLYGSFVADLQKQPPIPRESLNLRDNRLAVKGRTCGTC